MMYSNSKNKVVINLAALQHNYKLMRSQLSPGADLLAMVKADGYGHGMIEAAFAFSLAGCEKFGVAEIGEGAHLRKFGLKGDIYTFLGLSEEQNSLVFDFELTPVVFSKNQIDFLSLEASRRDLTLQVHLKVDTGMGRLGINVDEVSDYIEYIHNSTSLKLAGIVSHLACADDKTAISNLKAIDKFLELKKKFGNDISLFHLANSGGVLNFPDVHCNLARAGIALYGYYPDGSDHERGSKEDRLIPAMSFKTEVIQVKSLKAGSGISYGHSYVAERDITVAILPTGYEDGLSRLQSNCGEVLIRGEKAPIVGRVCMNLCMVDVTDIVDVVEGDEVVLLGKQGANEISGEDFAKRSQTISYEILCMIGNNNQRVYVDKIPDNESKII